MNERILKNAHRRWVGKVASVLALTLLAAPARAAGGVEANESPARGRANAAASPPARTLLVLGDSLSAEYGLARGTGWVALLEERLAAQQAGWTVVNASISGETTAGGASRIGGLLDRHRPAAVIVELGGNDALRGLDLKATRDNLDRIVGASRKAGARVLLVGMQVPPNYGRSYTETFAQVFQDVAQAHEAPLVPFFLDGVADDMSLFQPDRIHPGPRAQPRMLDNVWPALHRLIGQPATASPPGSRG